MATGVELVELSELVKRAVASTHAELLRISRSTVSADIRKTELQLLLENEVVEEEVPFEEFADTTFAGEC